MANSSVLEKRASSLCHWLKPKARCTDTSSGGESLSSSPPPPQTIHFFDLGAFQFPFWLCRTRAPNAMVDSAAHLNWKKNLVEVGWKPHSLQPSSDVLHAEILQKGSAALQRQRRLRISACVRSGSASDLRGTRVSFGSPSDGGAAEAAVIDSEPGGRALRHGPPAGMGQVDARAGGRRQPIAATSWTEGIEPY